MTNRTFAIIKPDAVKNNYSGKIIDHILKSDFNILSAKKIGMTKQQAEGFYAVHKDKPFYEELTAFMSSGPSWVLVLEKENATSLGENTVHGSDSDENAAIEIGFFFSEAEVISCH
jgi:nucleoside-diphosphate kinase